MKFHANYVSVGGAGDYHQAIFESDQESDKLDTEYFLIQPPERGLYYIEAHDVEYIGHFRLRRVEFSPNRLFIEIDRQADNSVEITFSLEPSVFEQVARFMTVICG